MPNRRDGEALRSYLASRYPLEPLPERDSADFNVILFEGAPVPTPISGDLNDWSVTNINGNSIFDIVQDGIDGYAGTTNLFKRNEGWSVEIRFQVLQDAPSGPALGLTLSEKTLGHYYLIGLYKEKLADISSAGSFYAANLANGFHTLRFVQRGNGLGQNTFLDGKMP